MRPDFTETYDEEVWRVYGFFAYRVQNRADAEDLAQLTFERALRAWSRFDERRSSPRTWLLAIAHNLLVDHFRADRTGQQEPVEADGLDQKLAGIPDPGHDSGLDPDLARGLAQLQPREREIVALRFGGDLTGPEIA